VTLHPIYIGVSWLLLRWHDLWSSAFNGSHWAGTDWAWVLAIVGMVITLRIVLFPLFVKQIRSQRAMQKLGPELKALQERYKGDRETLQREMMELYRREKANPLMGCLPILLQAPVFLGVFWVLRRVSPEKTSEYAKTHYGWTVQDWDTFLQAKLANAPLWAAFGTPASELEGYGDPTVVKIVAVILIAAMIITTYLTTRQMILKTGWAQDPNQRMIQKVMLYGIPVILIFSGAIFAIGVVVYWTVNNLFSLAQQQYVLRKYPPPSVDAGGKPPKPGSKAHEKMVEEQREAEERRKSLAPKPGQKPKKHQPKPPQERRGTDQSASDSQDGSQEDPGKQSSGSPNGGKQGGAKQGGPGSGKNLSRSERIARAKKVSGAQQSNKKKKGKGGGTRAA
jgi:YidC/Oxa1 family membrane protein insertase